MEQCKNPWELVSLRGNTRISSLSMGIGALTMSDDLNVIPSLIITCNLTPQRTVKCSDYNMASTIATLSHLS